MADNLVKDNKCFNKMIRGKHTIDGINADETKVITITLDEEISEDAVCVVNCTDWPLHVEVQMVGNNYAHEGTAIISVKNESETAIANANLNYLFI